MKARYFTQETWVLDEVETCGQFPSLSDPEAEVYTVAQLLARHERGLMTNLNIGRDYAYPEFARLDDRDVEKDLNLEPTDRSHLADVLDASLEPSRKAQKEAVEKKRLDDELKAKADEEARIEAEVTKRMEKGAKGKTKLLP